MILDRWRPRQGSGRFFLLPWMPAGERQGQVQRRRLRRGRRGAAVRSWLRRGRKERRWRRADRVVAVGAHPHGRPDAAERHPPFIPATERSGASPALREQRTQGSHSSFVGAHPHGRPRGIERHAPPDSGDGAQRGEPRSTRAGATKALRRSKPRPVPCLGKAPAPVHRPPHSPGLAAALAASEEARRARVASRCAM